MVRSLPLELDQMVIGFAQEGLSVLESQKMRVQLSLVCRAWRDSIDSSKHLVVIGSSNVTKAANHLSNQRASGDKRLRIKSLYVKLQTVGSKAKAQALARLLSVVPNVERVELVAKYSSMKEGGRYGCSLGECVLAALERLPLIRSLSFGEDRVADYYPKLSSFELARLSTAWPLIESFDLTGCHLIEPRASQRATRPLADCANLVKLSLGEVSCRWTARSTVPDDLPASLTSLTICDNHLYATRASTDGLAAGLHPIPAGLRHLTLLDNRTTGSGPTYRARGALDSLISSAANLESLAVSPCAISDLSTSLAALVGLTDLSLVQGRTSSATPVSSDELIAFLASPTAVLRLSVSTAIYNKWSGMGKREVHAAARARNVQFLVI